jgi:hypothetical protein
LSYPDSRVQGMMKVDVGALDRLLTRLGIGRRYIGAMPTFTLAGVQYDHVQAVPDEDHGEYQSWEYGHWPRVEVSLALAGGGTVAVHAEASRWTGQHIHVRWLDDSGAFTVLGCPLRTCGD